MYIYILKSHYCNYPMFKKWQLENNLPSGSENRDISFRKSWYCIVIPENVSSWLAYIILFSIMWSEVKVAQLCPTLQAHELYSPWNSTGQNTGVGSLSLLQGTFPAQESNQGLCIAGGFFTSWATRESLFSL